MTSGFRAQLVALLPRLRRFAMGLTADRDEADDLVQAACERALARQHQWRPGSRLDSWLYRIIQTQRIDRHRRNRRLAVVPTEREADDWPDHQSADRAENQAMLDRTLRALAQLPEEQRLVMTRVVVEGEGYKEVAEALDIPVGTVMSRLARARQRLHRLLAPGEDN